MNSRRIVSIDAGPASGVRATIRTDILFNQTTSEKLTIDKNNKHTSEASENCASSTVPCCNLQDPQGKHLKFKTIIPEYLIKTNMPEGFPGN